MSVRDKELVDRDERFWAVRAKRYEKLEWASKSDYLNAFLDAGSFSGHNRVLDVGTGTGIIAHTIAPHVTQVVGIDISQDMLDKAADARFPNIQWIKMDAHDLKFDDGTFDRVTARMVFHHVIEQTQAAMRECYRVLEQGGVMVFSEGVPPTHHVRPFFTEMFKLKENRITFMEEDLQKLMREAGFKDIRTSTLFVRQASIRNWLDNSGLAKPVMDKIYQMHVDLDVQGKRDYNMTFHDNDCFIDMKFAILTGKK